MGNISPTKEKIRIDRINHMAATDREALVRESEALYHTRIEEIARSIAADESAKIIFIGGPSASGKTTTSLKLREALYALSVKSVAISLDNFLFNRDDLPILPDGMIDMESIRTVDIACLHHCLEKLLTTGRCAFPLFDFVEGKRRTDTFDVEIAGDFVVIIEGIHALNPAVKPSAFRDQAKTIYVSIKSEYYEGEQVVLNTRNLRLIRRMIRDYHFRGSSASNTLKMWSYVLAGEQENIRPYRMAADEWIDSVHAYEPLLYHHELLPILSEVDEDSPHYKKCAELIDMLRHFSDLPQSIVPENSMLREFIG